MAPMVAVLIVEGLPLLGCTSTQSASSSSSAGAPATAPAPTQAVTGRKLDGNMKVDDARKVSSAHLLSLSSHPTAAAVEEGEKDEKGGVDGGQDCSRNHHQRHGSRTKRLSVSILPFQETVLPVPVSQWDGGGVRGCS